MIGLYWEISVPAERSLFAGVRTKIDNIAMVAVVSMMDLLMVRNVSLMALAGRRQGHLVLQLLGACDRHHDGTENKEKLKPITFKYNHKKHDRWRTTYVFHFGPPVAYVILGLNDNGAT